MIHLLFLLISGGVLLYLVNSIIPMDGKIKQIINIVVILCELYYLAEYFHLFSLYRH